MPQSSEVTGSSSPRIQNSLKRIAILYLLTACIAGCSRHKEQKLGPSDIHRITREFVAAANSSAPPGTEVRGELRAFEKIANSSDHVEIRVFAKSEDIRDPALTERLLQSLGDVAARHALHQEPQSAKPQSQPQPEPAQSPSTPPRESTQPTEQGTVISLKYRHAGVITHTIHIHVNAASTLSRQLDPPADRGENALALAIGHTLAVTLEALTGRVPQAGFYGVKLAPVSEVLREASAGPSGFGARSAGYIR